MLYYYINRFPQIFELTEIVQEKEKKFKIYFLQMGVSHFSYVLSWLITYSIFAIISSICLAFVLANTFAHTSIYVFIFPLLFYFLSNVSMTYTISTLFKKYMIYFLLY